MVPFKFSLANGHHGTIRPVQKIGGPMEGKWMCRILGPSITGSSGVKKVFSEPNLQAAKQSIARFLHVSSVSVMASLDMVSPPASPRKRQRQSVSYDKYESSPNSLATCIVRRTKIMRGTKRIGRRIFMDKYQRFGHNHYHEDCCPATIKSQLQFPDDGQSADSLASSPNKRHRSGPQKTTEVVLAEVGRQDKQRAETANVLRERAALRESLRKLRRLFAERLDRPLYMVFDNKTLDDIVMKLPRSKQELLRCHGIGPNRYASFGASILVVINIFQQRQQQQQQNQTPVKHEKCSASRKKATPRTPMAATASSSTDAMVVDDDVQAVQTMTCEDILNQKFEDAKKNGYVISVDDSDEPDIAWI